MTKFAALLFRYLPNEAHFKAFDRFTTELNNADIIVKNAVGPLMDELNDWFDRETECIMWYRKSSLTALIADANRRLDHVLVGMSAQVNAASYSPSIAVSAAGTRLKIMLKSHDQVIKKPYLQEIGAVKAILSHLNGDMADDAKEAGILSWITEINTALNDFITLFEQREAQTLVRPAYSFPEVRRNIESVWRQIVSVVNAGAILNVSNSFQVFIDKLNPEIAYLNNEFHRVKHSIASSMILPIDEQPYTGEPCTPVPSVFYESTKGDVKLVLGKDFNVSYRNNVNAGNAKCTISGKGAYKGSKTVTFIIARAD
ncbi:MAG: DUF6261 family protein [Tannerella sp.]|jgi:hypothetical protein|nr:DUF6261 family protein [Tannerella sp.]